MPKLEYILGGVAALFAIATVFLGYQYYTITETRDSLTANLGTTEMELASSTDALAIANEAIEALSEDLEETEDDLRQEKGRNEEFEDQIKKISGTVSDLDKLSKTDEELLQKYSKVYFLNEHYIPSNLSDIPDALVYDENRDHKFHSDGLPFLEEMMEDAKEDGIELWIASSYRSYEYQSQLKGAYTVTYGAGANTFSADQGYSEHQLGTTIDFTTTGLGGGLTGFGNTPAYQWLTENAYKYGFILSYPESNAYYVYEPWHWRFVGTELADDLHDDGTFFYDVPQREIDQYLLHIFD